MWEVLPVGWNHLGLPKEAPVAAFPLNSVILVMAFNPFEPRVFTHSMGIILLVLLSELPSPHEAFTDISVKICTDVSRGLAYRLTEKVSKTSLRDHFCL